MVYFLARLGNSELTKTLTKLSLHLPFGVEILGGCLSHNSDSEGRVYLPLDITTYADHTVLN